MNTQDNIAAPATAVGGAVNIIRLSGPDVLDIANKIWQGKPLSKNNARKMLLGKIAGDQALAVYMKAPASYTGDDVVEFQCHGGAAVADAVLRCVLSAGCRLAEPGEFTCRAFINGKLDLLQAEAVSDIISSGSDAALKMAEKQLDGVLSTKINELCAELDFLRSECEARLDFPDEELDFDNSAAERIGAVARRFEELLATHQAGAVLRDGVKVALAGKPNAGKSSLLNALLGYDRAIVTPIPGATRDTLEENLTIRGIALRATDTAGLRESDDDVERLGVERTRKAVKSADVILWLLDSTEPEKAIAHFLAEKQDGLNGKLILCWNKSDLTANNGDKAFGKTIDYVTILSCDQYRNYKYRMPVYTTDHIWALTPLMCAGGQAIVARSLSPMTEFYYTSSAFSHGVVPVCKFAADKLKLYKRIQLVESR